MSASMAEPPYRIYDGPGSIGGIEKGFLSGHFSCDGADWTNFRLYDNRNALEDGVGIGEDGVLMDPESANIFVSGQVFDAGQFGFDVSSNMSGHVQVFRSLKQGVQVGFDLGGVLANVNLKVDVFDVVEDEAVRFSSTGTGIRTVTTTNGSPTLTITGGTSGGAGFYVISGQRIVGPNIPSVPGGFAVVKTVVGNVVTMMSSVDGSPVNATASGSVSANFRVR